MSRKVPCEVFCRIVGYYRPVSHWNAGKVAEYKDRKLFSINGKEMPVMSSCGCDALEA